MRSDDYLANKFEDIYNNSFDVKILQSAIHKIKIIRQLENEFDIGFMNACYDENDEISMTDDFFLSAQTLFRKRHEKQKPTNRKELMITYTSLLRHMSNNDIIISTQSRTKKHRDLVKYQLNDLFSFCIT